MKKVLKCLLCLGLLFTVVGCSSNNNTSKSNNSSKQLKADAVKIEDLDWKVEETITSGQKYVGFTFVNNSKYDILELKLKFTLKNDITDEQLKIFDSEKEASSWTDEEVKNLYMSGVTEKVTKKGAISEPTFLGFNGTYNIVEDISYYNLMEPDTVSIAYIDNNKIYVNYYDFKEKKYTSDTSSGIDAYTWSNSDISKLIPKPELKIGQTITDNEKSLYFDGYDVSKEFYDNYIQKCVDKGFNKTDNSSDHFFKSVNKDGYRLDVSYYDESESMAISLKAPDDDSK